MKRTIIFNAIAAFGLLAAACSGDGMTTEVASLESTDDPARVEPQDPTAEPVSDEDAVLAFTSCLRDEGVDVEDPTVDADGNLRPPRPVNVDEVDRDAMRGAFEACSSHLENTAFGFARIDRTEREARLYDFAACMRDNGYDMPDPDLSAAGTPGQGNGPGEGGGPFGAIDRDDPTFEAAQESCNSLLGGGRFPGSGAGPTG